MPVKPFAEIKETEHESWEMNYWINKKSNNMMKSKLNWHWTPVAITDFD